MADNSFTHMADSLLNSKGQDNFRSDTHSSIRVIYSAVVRDNNDFAGLNRLKCEIVTVDANGVIKPGKDKDTPLLKLPICIPLIPEFMHVRPQLDEMVLIICENPNDLSSPRYWIGPVISQQSKLPYQSYSDAMEIFKINTFSQNNSTSSPTTNSLTNAGVYFPQPSEIAMQGRKDSNLTFSPRRAILQAGTFQKDSTSLNTTTPANFEVKQVDNQNTSTGPNTIQLFSKLTSVNISTWKPYSQTNAISTNINIYSPEGKFRNSDNGATDNSVEKSARLGDFGDVASTLHPSVFGDELLILLRLILKFMRTHTHTPQSAALTNALTEELDKYLTGDKLQDLVSNVVRIN